MSLSKSHGGVISTMQASDQEWLNYIIRFQNTGTNTAFRIIVRDTLNDYLDGTTLELLNTSHTNCMVVQNDNYIQWRFDDIDLWIVHPMNHLIMDLFNSESNQLQESYWGMKY